MKLPCDDGKLPSQVQIGIAYYMEIFYSPLGSLLTVSKPYQTALDSISCTWVQYLMHALPVWQAGLIKTARIAADISVALP